MSETVIFIVGVVVFATTVWGAVMAGGLAMQRAEIEQSRLRLVGRDRAFEVTGVIDASTDDHILVRDGQGVDWALPRHQVAFAIAEGSTSR